MRHAVSFNLIAIMFMTAGVAAQDDFERWAPLKDPFPSTGGGGTMIHDYDPVVAHGKCTTNFRAIEPDGTVYRNAIVFEAVATQGGVLCTNGSWRSLDGSATGTTPFRVFIKDGVKRGSAE